MISNKQVLGLHQALESKETVMVEFEKADGELREMVCVIGPDVSGDDYEFKGDDSKVGTDPDNQLVWEPAIKQWRKFKYSTVVRWAINH